MKPYRTMPFVVKRGIISFDSDGLPSAEWLHVLINLKFGADGRPVLYHRHRPLEWFEDHDVGRTWNTKNAGRKVFDRIGKTGYMVGGLLGKMLKAHRVIYKMVHGGLCPSQIDHKNGNRADNHLSNLKAADVLINRKNVKKRCDNSSGVCGVHWAGHAKRWRAEINNEGVRLRLGYFNSLEEAARARKLAEVKYGYTERHGS